MEKADTDRAMLAVAAVALLMPVLLAALVFPTPLNDTRELLVWGRFFPLTTPKHPPMMAWLGGLVDLLAAPTNVWAVFANQLLNAVGLLYLHAIVRIVVDRRHAALYALLFALCAYMQVGPLSYALNADILQLPAWLAVVYHAMRAADGNRWRHWIGFGAWAAAAFLVKYAALLLFMAILFAAVAVPRYRAALLNLRLTAAAAVFAVLVAPHLFALVNDSGSIAYAEAVIRPTVPLSVRLTGVANLAGGAALFLAPSWIICAVGLYQGRFRRSGQILADAEMGDRVHFLLLLLVGALAIVLAAVLLLGLPFPYRMGAPFFGLAAIGLLPFLSIVPDCWENTRRRIYVVAAAISASLVVGAVAIYGVFSSHDYHQEPLADAAAVLDARWRSEFACGPAFILGDRPSAHGISLYGKPDRPVGIPLEDVKLVRWFDPARLENEGAIVVFRKEANRAAIARHLPGVTVGEPHELTLPLLRTWSGRTITYVYFFVAPHCTTAAP